MTSSRTNKEPTQQEIERVVGTGLRVRSRVREASGTHAVADCPFCNRAKHLYVNVENGLWDCKVCEEAGNIFKLANHLGIRVRDERANAVNHVGKSLTVDLNALRPKAVIKNAKGFDRAKVDAACAAVLRDSNAEAKQVHAYLRDVRKIDDDTIKRFRLTYAWINEDGGRELAVGIPYLDGEHVPLLKLRNLESDKEKRKFRRTAGGYSGLFNAAGIKGCKQVVLCEGELDAVSLWQMGVHNAASTSLGAKKTIPTEWLESLADAEDIVLWYDDDEKGQEAALSLCTQLGSWRCRIAFMPPHLEVKDANAMLQTLSADEACEIARKVIADAKHVVTNNIVQPSAFSDMLASEIMAGEKTLGVATAWPELNRLLGGVRWGEITLVTGHTAHGKTTWTVNFCRQLAQAGHPVLLSALENGPLAIARKIFQMQHGRPISDIRTDDDKEKAIEALASINRDPVFILDLYGLHTLDKLVDAITVAVKRHGVKVVEIDHLHFLDKGKERETRDHLDRVISTLTALSRTLNIHIFLIAHPNGSIADDQVPTGSDIKGTSTAKQNADNGISVFRVVDMGTETKKMKVKDSLGRRIEMELGSKDVLVSVWKTRHDEAREGCAILEFESKGLVYNSKIATPLTTTRDASNEVDHHGQSQSTYDEDDLFG